MRCQRQDGEVFGFTAHDQNLEIGGVNYWSIASFSASDVAASNAFDVANMEAEGSNDTTLAHPLITAEELRAGLWDGCAMRVFLVNWSDLTMGTIVMQTGNIGEVTMQRGRFRAEFRSMVQGYSRSIGRIYAAACDATLGDARCGKDLTAFTFDSDVDSVSADQLTIFDAARSEPGPAGGVAIDNISAADPCVIETAAPHGFIDGQPLILSEIVGPSQLNTAVIVNAVLTSTSFSINADSSEMPAYVSGGMATPADDSGYFDYGKVTMTSGLNTGITRDIKSYVPGQFILQDAFPYTVAPGDDYTIVAGCNKLLQTCIDKFDNRENHRGFPYLKGNDKLAQVGRS